MMNTDLVSIGEASNLTGIHVKSLRYYDRMNAFVPEYIDPRSGYRYYGFNQLQEILAVRICLDTGIVLGDLEKYRSENETDYSTLIIDAEKNIEKEIELLERKKDYLDYLRKEISLNAKEGEVLYNNEEYGSLAFWRVEIKDKEADALSKKELYLKLAANAKTKGYQISPLYYGMLMECRGRERRIYAIASIADFLQREAEDEKIYYLPKGKYIRKATEDIDVRKADELFPELFDNNSDRVVISTIGISSSGRSVCAMSVSAEE